MDLDLLKSWIGRSESREEVLAPFPANALAATLDRADPAYREGDALPPLWHWLHFLPISPLAEAGPDGHPARGGFLPPVPLPRRMWAGSRLTFLRPLLIGEKSCRVSTVTKVEHKAGKSGELVFVTVRHVLSGEQGPAIEEEHDIVYRGPADAGCTNCGTHPGTCRGRLALADPARSGAAVPLFGADLQFPPHPLRPRLCDAGRGLSGPHRAWAADRDPAAGRASTGAARG